MEKIRQTILIVENEFELKELLRNQLEASGYEIQVASGGYDAIKFIQKSRVDLVITEALMKEGSGIELLESIQSSNLCIPVIMFLKWFNETSVREVYEKGGFALFAKPCDPAILIRAVQIALAKVDLDKRQRHWRGPASFDVQINVGGQNKMCRIKNLSTGGMFVSMRENFPNPGDMVGYKIHFSDGFVFHVEGQGVVRWVRKGDDPGMPRGAGVEFSKLPEETKDKIWGLVNYLKTRQYIPKLIAQ